MMLQFAGTTEPTPDRMGVPQQFGLSEWEDPPYPESYAKGEKEASFRKLPLAPN